MKMGKEWKIQEKSEEVNQMRSLGEKITHFFDPGESG